MSLEAIIKSEVNSKNSKGIVVRLGNQSVVSWWDDSNNKINSTTINLEVESSLSFRCKDGKVEIEYI